MDTYIHTYKYTYIYIYLHITYIYICPHTFVYIDQTPCSTDANASKTPVAISHDTTAIMPHCTRESYSTCKGSYTTLGLCDMGLGLLLESRFSTACGLSSRSSSGQARTLLRLSILLLPKAAELVCGFQV